MIVWLLGWTMVWFTVAFTVAFTVVFTVAFTVVFEVILKVVVLIVVVVFWIGILGTIIAVELTGHVPHPWAVQLVQFAAHILHFPRH